MDIHAFTNHDIARARAEEAISVPETLGGASRRPEAFRRAPFAVLSPHPSAQGLRCDPAARDLSHARGPQRSCRRHRFVIAWHEASLCR